MPSVPRVPSTAEPPRPYVVVAFHAHPDDEALYTGGTLAQAAADGHRVVLVMATVGEAGLASRPAPGDRPLGELRRDELSASARILGVARVVLLGYADSGYADSGYADDEPPDGREAPPNAFARADVDAAAERVAAVLREERADVLTVYDAAGGYGHADHAQVHRVGVRAAEIAGTPVVLEATVDRTVIVRAVRLLRAIRRLLPGLTIPDAEHAYTARNDITHKVDVRRTVDLKRSAIAAHVSQSTAPAGVRTLTLILRLPRPVYRRVFRHEWFVERGRTPARPPLGDIFATLRDSPTSP
jgi:LmbE family N-acetylglucosaminyl deacetylase